MSHKGRVSAKREREIGVRGLKIKGKGERGMYKPEVSDGRQKGGSGKNKIFSSEAVIFRPSQDTTIWIRIASKAILRHSGERCPGT